MQSRILAAYWLLFLLATPPCGLHRRRGLEQRATLVCRFGLLFSSGGMFSAVPIMFVIGRPGRYYTRHVIAVSQMLMSALLIHLTGGRIETHFHIFGSLAFLAFYRDWSVLVSASAVVAAHHFLFGIYWPHQIFGVVHAHGMRWMEHSAWVVFEDFFLVISILQGRGEMRAMAERQAALEADKDIVEQAVTTRTRELVTSQLRHKRLRLDRARDANHPARGAEHRRPLQRD